MKAYNAKITKTNILNYFNKSGLTIEVFANLLGVSKRWLEYLISENEDYEFDPNVVQKACDFFNTDYGKFTTSIQKIPSDLRDLLQKKHARNPEYNKILSDAPSVQYIIENMVLKDDEFANAESVELKTIKRIIRKHYKELKLTNLSKDLQNSKFIKHWPHPTKKNTNLYAKK